MSKRLDFKAVGDAIRRALGDDFSRERQAIYLKAFTDVRNTVESEIKFGAKFTRDVTDSYLSYIWTKINKELQSDPLMPARVNYIQAYNALLRLEDREKVLDQISRMLARVGKIIAAIEYTQPQVPANFAAQKLLYGAYALNRVAVPELNISDDEELFDCDQEEERQQEQSLPVLEQCMGLLEDAFSQVVSESTFRPSRQEIDKAKIEKKAAEIALRAKKEVDAERRRVAACVSGATLELSDLPEFDGVVTFEGSLDPRGLHALYNEVSKSFETYSKVVWDNGLFSAFPDDNCFGKSIYRSLMVVRDADMNEISRWYCQDEGWSYAGTDRVELSQLVEESPGDDLPFYVAYRMSLFNQIEYEGLLDDDFQIHVAAFWFGFKKLMDFINEYSRDLNMRSLYDYFVELKKACGQPAWLLGAQMSEEQLSEWAKRVDELKRGF